jgi:hypothetical protein
MLENIGSFLTTTLTRLEAIVYILLFTAGLLMYIKNTTGGSEVSKSKNADSNNTTGPDNAYRGNNADCEKTTMRYSIGIGHKNDYKKTERNYNRFLSTTTRS